LISDLRTVPAMRAREPVVRPSSIVAALACAALLGCTEAVRAPQPVAPISPPPPAPATVPTPAAPSPPAPAPSSSIEEPGAIERGLVSMYGDEFAGRKTASGTPFDPSALTMAHRTLPFGPRVRVTNLENHRSVDVVVNDRGPFVAGRIADLSEAAARRIGMVTHGVVKATLEVLAPGGSS
jgi:rare lipoprotein A